MDAHAHLLSLGWAGPGHSLDSRPYKQKGHRGLAYDPKQVRSTGNGLVKPLLVSQRKARHGVGKRAHEPQAGNEWWLKGFESALGNIGKSESERTSGTATAVAREQGGDHDGLYSFFVKGQNMEGTMDRLESRPSKKRKSGGLGNSDSPSTDESDVPNPTAEFEQVSAFIGARDKDKKRRDRRKKASATEEFVQVTEFFAATTDRKKTRSISEDVALIEVQTAVPPLCETKEERRERRRRKDQKEVARQAAKATEKTPEAHDIEDPAARAARKAERKRRKAELAAKVV